MFSTARHKLLHAALVSGVLLLGCAPTALGQSGGARTGGAAFVPPPPPPEKATIWHGRAIAPAGAPRRVKRVIAAANRIVGKPYRYGGGHRGFRGRLDKGYDCSGSVSHALHGGRFLRSPLASGNLMRWARRGPGRWITVYASRGHAYIVVAGLRFDTGFRDDPRRSGPAWSKRLRKSSKYVARHPRRY